MGTNQYYEVQHSANLVLTHNLVLISHKSSTTNEVEPHIASNH